MNHVNKVILFTHITTTNKTNHFHNWQFKTTSYQQPLDAFYIGGSLTHSTVSCESLFFAGGVDADVPKASVSYPNIRAPRHRGLHTDYDSDLRVVVPHAI